MSVSTLRLRTTHRHLAYGSHHARQALGLVVAQVLTERVGATTFNDPSRHVPDPSFPPGDLHSGDSVQILGPTPANQPYAGIHANPLFVNRAAHRSHDAHRYHRGEHGYASREKDCQCPVPGRRVRSTLQPSAPGRYQPRSPRREKRHSHRRRGPMPGTCLELQTLVDLVGSPAAPCRLMQKFDGNPHLLLTFHDDRIRRIA